MEGFSKKEKKTMDIDYNVVIARGEGAIRGLNGIGKNIIKIFKKERR